MFEIKKVVPDEVGLLADKAGEVWREIYYPIVAHDMVDYMIEHYQSAPAIAEQINEGYRYYWAVYEGEKAGFIAIIPKDGMMYLSKFYLFKEFRGKKISHDMMDFVVSEAKKENLKGVFLNVNKYNDRAIQAYEHLGLKKLRETRDDVGGGYLTDDYIMGVYFTCQLPPATDS